MKKRTPFKINFPKLIKAGDIDFVRQELIVASEGGDVSAAIYLAWLFEGAKPPFPKDLQEAERFYGLALAIDRNEAAVQMVRFLEKYTDGYEDLLNRIQSYGLFEMPNAQYWLYKVATRNALFEKSDYHLTHASLLGHCFARRDVIDHSMKNASFRKKLELKYQRFVLMSEIFLLAIRNDGSPKLK